MIESGKQGRRSLIYTYNAESGLLGREVRLLRPWAAVPVDFAASFVLLFDLLATPEALLAVVGSLLSVTLYHTYGASLSSNMSWTAVSFMLVFPLTNAIANAFARRERAVALMCGYRAQIANLYLAHTCWDWPGAEAWGGRSEAQKKKGQLPLAALHGDRVRSLLLQLVDSTEALLLIPIARLRDDLVKSRGLEDAEQQGRQGVVVCLGRLHRAVEDMKAAGMPANEASRINQYNAQLSEKFEMLWALKVYRTSNGMRAISRIIIQLLPVFYGPYYIHLARGEGGETNLAFACSFACLVSLLLVALANLEAHLENPFMSTSGGIGADNVRVRDEMRLCRETLRMVDADASEPWYGRSGATDPQGGMTA